MHEQAAHRAAVHAQPMARPHEAPRVSAAPASRPAMPHVAQPNVSHGSPMNAHAQMPAPRAAAPAMPHGGGGAPHIMPHRAAAVRRPAVPVAATKSTKVANESPALAPGFLLGADRVPCAYNLRSFFAGRFHRS